MRKRIQKVKFSRKIGPRKALLSSTARALFVKGKIITTEARAKEVSSLAQRLVTKAKKGDLTATRKLASFFDKATVKKVIEETAPKYKDRKGGYIRITKLGPRSSDGAKMAVLEFVD